jgi:hypothetical protein
MDRNAVSRSSRAAVTLVANLVPNWTTSGSPDALTAPLLLCARCDCRVSTGGTRVGVHSASGDRAEVAGPLVAPGGGVIHARWFRDQAREHGDLRPLPPP